jgi:hypothetical protein
VKCEPKQRIANEHEVGANKVVGLAKAN